MTGQRRSEPKGSKREKDLAFHGKGESRRLLVNALSYQPSCFI